MEENIIQENITEENNNIQPEKKKRSKLNIIFNVVIIVLLVILAIRLIFSIFFGGVYVVGDSMMPNFYGAVSEDVKGGDYVYVNKFAKPERGDVVVIKVEEDGKEKAIIKRVIGLEGDTLYLKNGQLFIKYAESNEFEEYIEEYVHEEYNNPLNPYNTTKEIIVPENCLYVLGDNRNISQDSRYEGYGCFDMDRLLGVVTDWSIKYKETISNIYNFFKI